MDNITHLVPVTKSQCVIKLDAFQYNYYQQSCIEIHSPEGEYLESIGYDIQKQIQRRTNHSTAIADCFAAITLRENYARGGIACAGAVLRIWVANRSFRRISVSIAAILLQQ